MAIVVFKVDMDIGINGVWSYWTIGPMGEVGPLGTFIGLDGSQGARVGSF